MLADMLNDTLRDTLRDDPSDSDDDMSESIDSDMQQEIVRTLTGLIKKSKSQFAKLDYGDTKSIKDAESSIRGRITMLAPANVKIPIKVQREIMKSAMEVAIPSYAGKFYGALSKHSGPAKKRSFAVAKQEIIDHLVSAGWKFTSRDMSTGRSLKVPYAADPHGEYKLWFKSQAVYLGTGSFKDARSIHVDVRNETPSSFMDKLSRWMREDIDGDTLDLIDEGYDAMKWMKQTSGKLDVGFEGGNYVPAKQVLGNREAGRQTDEINKIGENLFGRMYASEFEGRKGLWVTYRNNRHKQEWSDKMMELISALAKAGYKSKYKKTNDGGVDSKSEVYALFDQKKIRQAEAIHKEYVTWMAGEGSRGAQKYIGEDINSLVEASLSSDMAEEKGIKLCVGSGDIVPGALVKNTSGEYGIFVGYNDSSGTVNVMWSRKGVFSLSKLKSMREDADVLSLPGDAIGWGFLEDEASDMDEAREE